MLGQLLPVFEVLWIFHLKSLLGFLDPEHKAPTRPKRRKLQAKSTRLFPRNSSLQQHRLRGLKFQNEYLLAFLFLSSIIGLCSFSALRAHPSTLRPSFSRSNPRPTTRRIQIMHQSLSHLYSLPISLILERTFVHKAQKKAHPPYPDSLPSRLCDTRDILTQNRFYLAPHQEVRVFTSLGRVRISNCHGMSVCPSVRPERRRGLAQ